MTISESEIEGVGLFAIEDVPIDTELGIIRIQDSRFENGWIRTPLGGFINHSETPNCRTESREDLLILITSENIDSGQELTLFYTLYKPTRV